MRRIAEFFGLKRNLVILLIATFAIGAGEELWMRFLPKYLQALGATVFVIGVTAFFLWFGISRFRKMEKSFADLI